MTLRDPETGQVAVIDTRSNNLKEKWRVYLQNHEDYLTDIFQKAGVDRVEIDTAGSVVEPLTRLFDRRRRRL